MASILDLPPEIINLIILHLKITTVSHPSDPPIQRRAAIDQAICPWSVDEASSSQLLTSLGQDFGIAGRDVVALRSVHQYIKEYIERSGCCEMVDVTINVMFKVGQSASALGISNHHQMQGCPLITHLQRYPKLDGMTLDFTQEFEPSSLRYLDAYPSPNSNWKFRGESLKKVHHGMRRLRIQLPPSNVAKPEYTSAILARLARSLQLPNLRQLHITIPLSDGPITSASRGDFPPGEENRPLWNISRCLDFVADSWRSLQVIKLCAHITFLPKGGSLVTLNLWPDVLRQVTQATRRVPVTKVELCFVYSWANGYCIVPLELSQQRRDSNFGWSLKDNLMPIDAQSVREAISYIQATEMVSVPYFDLCVRYFDPRNSEGTSQELCEIQYRLADSSNAGEMNQRPNGHAPSKGIVVCDINWPVLMELHQRSWIRQQNALLPSVEQVDRKERLRKLQEDYAVAFP